MQKEFDRPLDHGPKGADPRLVPARGRRSNMTVMIFAGASTALIFGSRVILQEIQMQPDMTNYETIYLIGVGWHGVMQTINATALDHALHASIRDVEAKRFDNAD